MKNRVVEDIYVLITSTQSDQNLLFQRPKALLAMSEPEGLNQAFDDLERGLEAGLWAAGFLSYELGYLLEKRLEPRHRPHPILPLLWFGLFDPPTILSRDETETWLSANKGRYQLARLPEKTLSRSDYKKRFEIAKEKIEAGDIYQLNLTFKSRFQIEGDPMALYHDLAKRQPVDHGAFINTPDFSIASISPELFLQRDGQMLKSRPMKGTEPRGETPQKDALAKERLYEDAKQRAENLMIVDLMRNDIARVSKVGTVSVPDLFTVETYPTLHQMTSTVSGELHDAVSFKDIISGLFPAGSITGAPKIRAMEIIHDLEGEARGAYCGSIGYVAPDRSFNLNVAIRTLTFFADGRGEIGIGSGVVADSKADQEYEEALLKMRFLEESLMDFQLFETMLFKLGAGIWLLDGHMNRLSRSAKELGFVFDRDHIAAVLEARVKTFQQERMRVRLTLEKDGTVALTATALPPFDEQNPAPINFVISKTRLQSDNYFLKHKTTNRALYDEEFRHYHESVGADEVIYLNERGELSEGSRTNIFLLIKGELLTPPLSSGALPGTLRERMLLEGKAKEALLTGASLKKADQIYLGNSVRGLQPATLLEGE